MVEKSQDNYFRPPRPGRPRLLTPRAVRRVGWTLARGAARNATDAQQKLYPSISARTMRRYLCEIGLHGRVRRHKPYLSRLNYKQRRVWGKGVAKWTQEQWDLVIFSDESKYNLFGSDGRQWCRRRVGEENLDRNVIKDVKHGGGNLMVWGCITSRGVGRLHRINGIMNAQKYCDILETSLLGTLSDHGIRRRRSFFQQDNDRKHTSRLAVKWFEAHHITTLPWPSASPDMNIIEHVWVYLDTKVRQRNPLPTSLDTLWAALQEEWEKLDPAFIRHLYDSIPSRVQDLNKAHGHATRY